MKRKMIFKLLFALITLVLLVFFTKFIFDKIHYFISRDIKTIVIPANLKEFTFEEIRNEEDQKKAINLLLDETNRIREENGLNALTLNEKLNKAAQHKAIDMITKNYWSHNSPEGLTPWDFIKGAGYDYVYAGENLADGYITADGVLTTWMQSPEHRENILKPEYTEVGFSIEHAKSYHENTYLVVAEYGSLVK